jgi:hypothetical protein
MTGYIITVHFHGDEDELEHMKEGIDQAGGHVMTTVLMED